MYILYPFEALKCKIKNSKWQKKGSLTDWQSDIVCIGAQLSYDSSHTIWAVYLWLELKNVFENRIYKPTDNVICRVNMHKSANFLQKNILSKITN